MTMMESVRITGRSFRGAGGVAVFGGRAAGVGVVGGGFADLADLADLADAGG